MHQTSSLCQLAPVVLSLIGCASLMGGCEKAPSESRAPRDQPGKSSTTTEPARPVSLEVVKYDDLMAAIKAQQGKIVVMDLWATWCVPCKQEFPHLVELHQRHLNDGVVCVSVSLDKPDQRDAALTFLKSNGAGFPNFLLLEDNGGWDQLDVRSIPAVFVYDRAGKRVGKFTNDDPAKQFTYADVEKLIGALRARSAGATP